MTAMVQPIIGASSASSLTWKTINWNHVSAQVKRLQMRIAKAIREKSYGKAKALQWLLTHSFSAKLLVVRQVTQSLGAKTPGVDGIVWKTQSHTAFTTVFAVSAGRRKRLAFLKGFSLTY